MSDTDVSVAKSAHEAFERAFETCSSSRLAAFAAGVTAAEAWTRADERAKRCNADAHAIAREVRWCAVSTEERDRGLIWPALKLLERAGVEL